MSFIDPTPTPTAKTLPELIAQSERLKRRVNELIEEAKSLTHRIQEVENAAERMGNRDGRERGQGTEAKPD